MNYNTTHMGVSLHLLSNLEQVRACLEPLLLPDSTAILVPRGAWLSIYAEQLSSDISDIEELAAPLSELSEVYAIIAERQLEVYVFSKGALQQIQSNPPPDLPDDAINEFEVLQSPAKADLLPSGSQILENEAAKPGLAEFFGRSEDE